MKFLIILILFSSCQGYRFRNTKNPFEKYGIKSVSIAPFYNHSSLSNLTSEFTKQMYLELSDFSQLKVVNDNNKADAILIGLITSEKSRSKTVVTKASISAKSVFENEIGNSRKDFYLPTKTNLSLKVKIMLIRDVSKHDIKLLKSQGELIDPRVILVKSFDVNGSFDRLVLKSQSINFVGTQNAGALRSTVLSMAKESAKNFKEAILYAF